MKDSIYKIVRDIPGWLTKHEGKFLEKAVRSVTGLKGAIVEIGSFCGKSTIWLAQTRETVFAIDPHKGEVSGGKTKPTKKEFLINLKQAGIKNSVIPIIQTSKDAALQWNKPCKLLFIDGLHDFNHAQEDFSLWNRWVIDGGIIAMHDSFCGWEGAGDVAMRQIVYSSNFREIGVVGSIIFGIKGSASMWERIHIVRNQLMIELCSGIYRSLLVPKWVQFILIHKLLRILLINRFSSFG